MPERVKEKLVELLCKVQDYGTKNTCEECSVTVECKGNETVADHLIAHGVTVREWVPVTERLPEKCDDYILAVAKDAVYDRTAIVKYIDGEWWDLFYGHIEKEFYWMPLPEPPKGE